MTLAENIVNYAFYERLISFGKKIINYGWCQGTARWLNTIYQSIPKFYLSFLNNKADQ